MYELILVGSGFIAGAITVLIVFRYGMNFATTFIYRIKEDIPLEEMGKPTEQELSGTE